MSARTESQTVFRAAAVALVLLSLVGASPAAAVTTAATPTVAEQTEAPAIAESTSTQRASGSASAVSAAAAQSSPTIDVDTVLSLTPDRPGSIGVVQTFDTPEEVTELRVTLDPESTVTESDGFSHVEGQTWEWDGETASPELRYDMAANRTTDATGPMSAGGQYLYADVGEWALVRQPNIGLQWRYRGNDAVEVNRSTRVDGEGAVGGVTAFLGPHEVHTREVAGQEIRLVVPDAADLAAPPEQILDSLANASRSMQVGDRDQTVFAVAAPTDRVGWAVQGLQIGESDFWARANQPVDEVGNTWLHEYVHTRQSFQTADSGRWFTEASATWYAALLSQQQEGVGFDDLSRFLARGTASPQADSVLADPTSWQNNAHYWKGALVAGELDRQIRLATDGGASLQGVLAALNDRTSPITNEDILAAVGDAGTQSTRNTAERLTTTSDVPSVWNRSAHRTAFGGDTALLRVDFDRESDVRATGPYRNATVSGPVTLATGESLAVRTTVENLGGAAGDYTVKLRVDDDAVASRNGTLAPGETTTVALTHQFTETGRYTVSVAGEQFTVRVREPATPTVTDVRVDPTPVERGGEVAVTATVSNDETVPGETTVAFTRDGETVRTVSVTVAPGETETVGASVTMPETGDHRVGAGDQTVDVRVEGTGTAESTATTAPGFGSPAAVAAILAAFGLFARRSRG